MTSSPYENAAQILQRGGDQRVWSLITTLFGDMASGPGDQISGVQLTAIAEKLDIKSEAMRVALHRLRKDGWIESRRSGRVSHYALTDFGSSETRAARKRIYGAAEQTPDNWHLQIAPALPNLARKALREQMRSAGYIELSATVFLRSGAVESRADCFGIDACADHLPGWVQDLVFPKSLVQMTNEFEKSLIEIEQILQSAQSFSTAEIIALRVLVVHHWRKIVLRSRPLPRRFHPAEWRIDACRALVGTVLQRMGIPNFDMLQ